MLSFKERINSINADYSKFESLHTVQVNLGDLCNLRCTHCHTAASPSGHKVMGQEVMDKIIRVLRRKQGVTLDITGGCPEMNPHFQFLINGTDNLSLHRMVRSNLTILNAKDMEWLGEFYREHKLVIVASLPCFIEANVDRQRGEGVFVESVAALRKLNALGYGTDFELNLVSNPGGDYLPGHQETLERTYKEHLQRNFGIVFHRLYTIANAPIGRFKTHLEEKGRYQPYMDLLRENFNPDAARNMMCRTMVSVDWRGALFNCDFNQAMGMPMTDRKGNVLHVEDLDEATAQGRDLDLAEHCYCCTAGAGSSCTGVLAA